MVDDIDVVVLTHGNPIHLGNLNFFGDKPILFNSQEYLGNRVSSTQLKNNPFKKLSTNVEVWKTPGQTQADLSVIVRHVDGYGTMAITGDLIPSEQYLADYTDVMKESGIWDANIKRQNANLIVCMVDWIIPGHGLPFEVTQIYRRRAGCTRMKKWNRTMLFS
ncbi:hypothetical protein AB6A40_010033 [Gnathostoma spinigerum]|uniref:Lactamase_B domain-containing protein n=1 Tax=Gnathostoma spinigerum TaxID=75299 RepID=A0ABD6ETM5_9BILA